MKPISTSRLYTFVDTAYLHGRDPAEVARQLCDGGSDLIQLRAKNAPLDEVRRLAEAVLPVCARAGVTFVLNDHPQLALQLGAPICHLGQEDEGDTGARADGQDGLGEAADFIERGVLRAELYEVRAAVAKLPGDFRRVTPMQVGGVNESVETGGGEGFHAVGPVDTANTNRPHSAQGLRR